MSYHPTLAKYLMVVSTPSISPSCVGNFDTYVLESNSLTGPWSAVSYLASFGPEAYFVHFPSRFMDLSYYPATPINAAHALVRSGPHAPLARAKPPHGATPEQQAAAASAARKANLTEHLAPLPPGSDGEIAAFYNLFLSYSADFASGSPNPPGSGYHWCLQSTRIALSAGFSARLAARGSAPAPAPL